MTSAVEPDLTPVAHFRMRVLSHGAIAVGPGKVRLLEAIQAHGSISAAARQLGMSYRRAWLLIDELNRCLRSPATFSGQGGVRGGGSGLTPEGIRLVKLYRDIEAQARRVCQPDIDELLGMMRPEPLSAASSPPSVSD